MMNEYKKAVLTAKRTGITPIGISTGIHLKEELLSTGAHKTIKNMRELIRLVK